MKNSGKHIDYSKEEQSGSKQLKLSVIDIEVKKATPQHETTTTLVEQQKTEGYYLKAYPVTAFMFYGTGFRNSSSFVPIDHNQFELYSGVVLFKKHVAVCS